MTSDNIIYYLLSFNAVINLFLIVQSDQRHKSDNDKEAYASNFWHAYLYIVPFFVTSSIIKEIETKRTKQRKRLDLLTKEYCQFVDSWKIAATDLSINIQTGFVIQLDDDVERTCPVFVELFGSKLGVLIFSINDSADSSTFKRYGYYCFIMNPKSYATYNRDLWIDLLNDWGFYGDAANTPTWYTGEPSM